MRATLVLLEIAIVLLGVSAVRIAREQQMIAVYHLSLARSHQQVCEGQSHLKEEDFAHLERLVIDSGEKPNGPYLRG